jgi:hypothetical protein
MMADMNENNSTYPVTIYEVSAHRGGSGFNVHIAGFDGARQTMLGFETEAAAEAWIATDRQRSLKSL